MRVTAATAAFLIVMLSCKDPATVQVPEDGGRVSGFGIPTPSPLPPAPFVDLRAFGVTANCPTCNTANTAAVKAAITAFGSTGANLHFPAGIIYLNEGTVVSNISYKSSILVETQHDFIFSGEGEFATTLMAHGTGDGGAWDIMEIGKGSQRIEVRDLGFKWDNIASPPDQDHGHTLQITANSGASNSTQFISVHDVYFGPSIGDGIRISGTTQITEHVHILNVFIDNGGQANFPLGARSGIAFQRGYNDIEIGHAFIRGAKNSLIDFEPSGEITQNNLSIHDVYADNTNGQTWFPISIDGTSNTTPLRNCIVRNLWLLEGQLQIVNTDHCIFEQIHVIETGAGPVGAGTDAQGPLVFVYEYNHDLVLRDLDVQRLTGSADGPLLLMKALNSTNAPVRATVAGGKWLQQTNGLGLDIENCDQCTVREVDMRWEGSTPTSNHGVLFRADLFDIGNLLASDIKINSPNGKLINCVWYAAVANNISNVSTLNVQANNACTTGVRYDATSPHTLDATPILQANNFSGASFVWLGDHASTNKVFPIVVGSKGGSTARTFEGTVTPETNATGQQGDIYVWVNGDSTIRYQKGSGTGATGWRQLSRGSAAELLTLGAVTTQKDVTWLSTTGTQSYTLADGDATLDGFIHHFLVTLSTGPGNGTLTPTHLFEGTTHTITWSTCTATAPCRFDLIWDQTNTTWRVVGAVAGVTVN